MTQRDLDRQVAHATGETVCEIRRRGFSIADSLDVGFDPEPGDALEKHLDWDELGGAELPRRYHPRRSLAADAA